MGNVIAVAVVAVMAAGVVYFVKKKK